jgi:tetratricopeptide (TPR) repeat protein/glycosyltransferase involved in cell wall biosynthesis
MSSRAPASHPSASYTPGRQEAGRHFAEAVRHHTSGAPVDAATAYRRALAADPTLAEAHNNLGVLLRESDPEAAFDAFREAARLRPAYPEAQNNLGLMLQRRGQLSAAVEAFRAAVAADPRAADAQNNLGLALQAAGEPEAAVAPLQLAATLNPSRPEAHNNLGNAYLGLGRLDDALACYRRALELDPAYPEALNNLGAAHRARKDYDAAIPLLRRALELRPGYQDALHNLALTLPDIGGSAEIESILRAAVAADPDNPTLRATLATGLAEVGQYEEARRLALEVIAVDERCRDAWNVLGMCAFEARDFPAMLQAYERTLALDPRNSVARWNRALALLALGDYARGWPEYEVRWQLVNMMRDRRHFAQPEWDGDSLDGRTILLYTEQGFGDAIQFARFARELKRRWSVRIVLECVDTLVPLFRSCGWVDAVVPRGAPLPSFDVQLSLLSLPYKLGITLADLDGTAYLEPQQRPAAARVREGGAMKVGIVWSGRAPNPHLARRSLPLAQLAPLAEIPGVELYSLQVGDGSAQLAASPLAGRVTDLAPELRDFVDTASVLARLDLVITIDSAVAHLAGALGVPVWVMVMRSGDWRWLLDRADSPWYASARLFRQVVQDDWAPVVEEVAESLRALASEPGTTRDRAADAPAMTLTELPSRQTLPDGGPRFTLAVPFEMLATDAGFARYGAELDAGGVGAEVRVFLDEQLADGDALVDVGAGWGFVALGAATAPGRRVRVTAVLDTDADARMVRMAAAQLTGTLDVRQVPRLPGVSLDELAGDAPRLFVRVAEAAQLPELLATGAALLESGRLAGICWTPRDQGAAAASDAVMCDGLAAFGFQHFVLEHDEDGARLDPYVSGAGERAIFSLSPSYLAEQARDGGAMAAPAAVGAAVRRVGVDWQVGASSGWGIYGLNLVRRCRERADVEPLLLTAPALDGVPRELADRLATVVDAFAQLTELSRAHAGATLSAGFPVLRALGNGLLGHEPAVRLASPRDVGVVFFEDTLLDEAALARGRHLARLVAGSSWNAEVLRAHGLTNVVTVLQGVDSALFHPAPRTGRFAGRFVVFSGGKLEYRKGQDIVVAAFREFRRRHPEALLLTAWHNHWPRTMGEIATAGHVTGVPAVDGAGRIDVAGWLVRNGVPADAVVDVGLQPNSAMAALVREADAALFTNRAEGGTNLVAMECLASGVPTILSANTGHLDLVDDGRCFPLRAQGIARGTASFRGTDGWGESSVDEVLDALERIHADRVDAARRGQAAAAWMRDLSWDAQIDRLLDALADLL